MPILTELFLCLKERLAVKMTLLAELSIPYSNFYFLSTAFLCPPITDRYISSTTFPKLAFDSRYSWAARISASG